MGRRHGWQRWSLACGLVLIGAWAGTGWASSPFGEGWPLDPPGIADGATVQSPPATPRPELGVWTQEPTFQTRLRRVTDRSDGGGFGTHVYSQLQAFSADERYLLLFEDERTIVRRVADLAPLELAYQTWIAPRWHPREPATMLHFGDDDSGRLALFATDVDRAEVMVLFRFPERYAAIRANPSWEEASRDGRWLAGQAAMRDGSDTIFALDLTAGALAAEVSIDGLYAGPCEPDPEWGPVDPDWVAMSPTGRFLVVQWVRDGTERCSGLESFDPRSGAFLGRAYDGHGHGDLGLDVAGNDVFVTVLFGSPRDPNLPYLAAMPLPGSDTVAPARHLVTTDWAENHHVSCQGPPGACLVTYGGSFRADFWPFRDEVFLVATDVEDGAVRRLAHHRSSGCGYWVQPRASVSRSGALAIFASDWSAGTGEDGCGPGDHPLGSGEAYLIDLGGVH